MTDNALRQYVARIEWDESVLLGAFDAHTELVGDCSNWPTWPRLARSPSPWPRRTGTGVSARR